MKKLFVVFVLLCAFFMISCGSGSSKNDEKKRGELYGECYPDGTCNEGLDCDPEYNVCIKDPDFENDEDAENEILDDENDKDEDNEDKIDSDETDTDLSDDHDAFENFDNDNELADPCDSNPCKELEHSNGKCKTVSESLYSCGCVEGYYWSEDENMCIKPCDPNPCVTLANSTGECVQTGGTAYSCTCKSGYDWTGTQCKGASSISLSIGNICTNQTFCYSTSERINCPESSDRFYGQDAQYADLCTPQSFSVQRVAGDKVVVDNNTGLEWQQKISTETYTWQEAESYCAGLTYAGKNGWRLPMPQELVTILDTDKTALAIDTAIFPNMPTNETARLWSSKAQISTDKAFVLSVYIGFIYYELKSEKYNVICVYGDKIPKGVFNEVVADNGDVLITDSTTGLTWQKDYAPKMYWEKALKYCEGLKYGGYKNWRLPNKHELASLLTYERSEVPYSDISDMPTDGYFWSSSTDRSSVNLAWDVHFGDGKINATNKDIISNYVRCVVEPADLCNPNPCETVPNSTGKCLQDYEMLYSCECLEGYYWWGTEAGCIDKIPLGRICTGETKCYDTTQNEIACPLSGSDFYGQDAQYAALGFCKPKSFTVKTVSDQNIVVDNNTGLEWQQTVSEEIYTWEKAKEYCDNLEYSGYNSGWRIPTPLEFLTLVDNSKYDLAIDTTIFPNMPTDPSGVLWSSETKGQGYDKAWRFNPYYGRIMNASSSTSSLHVMCVHGNEMPKGNFIEKAVNGQIVVIDSTTGLMWQKDNDYNVTWQEALKACEDSDYAGFSDWRLPNKNEIATFLNHDKTSVPYSDFPDISVSDLGSSSSVAYNPVYMWKMSLSWGGYEVVFSTKTATPALIYKCVRQ